ncbi:MAG TPA: SafA/ExsA family spore coat assembly protein [Candidatus Deferrimicrobium sp.]|nr:SafA/ExsA family spore coat assembly protein [Candidatus Deferrimicrobium sp.]
MTTYIVQSGDTLWKISSKFKVSLSAILQANPGIRNPAYIYPGLKLNIPSAVTGVSFAQQVIALTNQERAKNGLGNLIANAELSKVANLKAQDMRDKNYFSHQSPTYGSPFEMMRKFGITYSRIAEENIASGQSTPQEVVNSWMNSPQHRQNILNAQIKQIGVGYAAGGSLRHYWVQMFIG